MNELTPVSSSPQQTAPWPDLPSMAFVALGLASSSPVEEFCKAVNLEKFLGSGNFGHVYRASSAGETFAVKVMSCSKGSLESREAWLMSYVRGHAIILPLLDAVLNPWVNILKMPLMDLDLKTCMSKSPTLLQKNLLTASLHLTSAVSHLVNLQVIHRDLHSKNVFWYALLNSLTFRFLKECVYKLHDFSFVELH